jgi:cell division protein FtsI (penicillin-binding protein 3)
MSLVHDSSSGIWRRLVEGVWQIEHAFERSKAKGRAADDTRLRIFFVLSLFALAFLTLAVEATRSALFSNAGRIGGELDLPPEARADLVDRNGRLLAVDLVHYGLYLNPNEVWDRAETRQAIRAALPRLSPQRLEKALASGRREYLIGGLTPQERAAVHDLGLPGVQFEEETRRVYPLGHNAAHLIGFADTAGHGLAGAERALDPLIRNAVRTGATVPLSVDLRIQGVLEEELRKGKAEFSADSAVGIVTDVRTGEILALSSQPDFDSAAPGAAPPANMVNHAAASVYEMGSTFKIFTLAMGLDSGAADINTMLDANGDMHLGARTIHDYHAEHRALSISDVFILSSNIGTARLALKAGEANLVKYFKSFGLLEPAKVELAEAARPITPRDWNTSTVASASFGHAISVSPLNVAAGVGAIMNGGVYHPLTVLKRQPGAKIEGSRRVVSEKTAREMLDLMRLNVLKGSGGKADAAGLRVGGKTGSAEKAGVGGYQRKKLVSSFAAVFPTDGPVDGPRYLVLILMDEPKATPQTFGFATAGWNATPVAGRVIDRIAPFVGVARAPATPFAAASGDHVPVGDDVSGAEQ